MHQDLAADKTLEAISQLSARICEAKAALHKAGKTCSDSQKELKAIHEGNKRLRASCEGMAKPPISSGQTHIGMFNLADAATFAHLSMYLVFCCDVLGSIICVWTPCLMQQ